MAMTMEPPDLDVIDIHFEYLEAVHELFGYNEDWKVIPLDDGRDYYWTLYLDDPKDPQSPGHLRYHEEKETLMRKEDGQYYEADIYTQRFLPKYVFKGGNYTMVSIDTHVDGNKFLIILSNDREIKDSDPYVSFLSLL